MKSILLIGVGRFGKHIALKLGELNHQVMVVDKQEERINAILPFVTNAQIGDSTNEEFLQSLGIRNYDVCIVAIGNDFQSSLETTSLLKEMGAKMVVSRAARDVQAISRIITVCPNALQYVAVSCTTNPVTHTADVDVKIASKNEAPCPSLVAIGSIRNRLPVNITSAKPYTIT